MANHSINTISEAIKVWKTKTHIPSFRFDHVKQTSPKLTDSGSGVQSFLDGCSYSPDTDEWRGGHLTLSPMDGGEGYVESCHLTLTGGEPWNGNYFFRVTDEDVVPSEPPPKYKGQYSYNGNKLPEGLRAEVVALFQYVLNNER